MSMPLVEAAASGPAQIRIGQCGACGHRYFPFQSLGCERCGTHGATQSPILVPARGSVLAAVGVWKHRSPGIEAPFQVADVLLDAGVKVRALIDADPCRPATLGTPVSGIVVQADDTPVAPLRFTVVGERA